MELAERTQDLVRANTLDPHANPDASVRAALGSGFNRRWAVILAGGDGTRLQEMTRLVSGDSRPKQFCSLFGEGTLLEQTRLRAARSISTDHMLFPLSSAHRPFFSREAGLRPSQRIVQPSNKGTAPPIVHSLLSIERLDSDALVAILPCDHHYSDERAFTIALDSAFETAARYPKSVVLLGTRARAPQTELGWIELGACARDFEDGSFGVLGFCEKPTAELALDLFKRGALWNTFVMVGYVKAFLEMVAAARTGLLKAFPREHLWSGAEVQIPAWLYERIYAQDFSRDVLSRQPGRLVARRMDNLEWSDLGHPERVLDVLVAAGLKPWWLKEWRAIRRPPAGVLAHAEAAVA